jgi:hypothetical protein
MIPRTNHPQPAYQTRFWFVRSSGNPNTFYRLHAIDNGVIHCTCKAATFSRRPCRHVRAVVAGQAIEAQPKRPALRVSGEGFGFESPREEAA